MPNWAELNMKVTLPTNKLNLFLSFFSGSDTCTPGAVGFDRTPFYRTILDSHYILSSNFKETSLELNVRCAWSVCGCLIDTCGLSLQDNIPYPSLEQVCKLCCVFALSGTSEEPGCGFGEAIELDAEDHTIYHDTYDLTNYYCEDCEMGFCSSLDSGAECPSCGKECQPG